MKDGLGCLNINGEGPEKFSPCVWHSSAGFAGSDPNCVLSISGHPALLVTRAPRLGAPRDPAAAPHPLAATAAPKRKG